MLNYKIKILIGIFIVLLNYGYTQMASPKMPGVGHPKYDLQVEYLEIKNYSTAHFAEVSTRVKKFNRTAYVVSGTFRTVKSFDDNYSAIFHINANQGNEYRLVGPPVVYEKLCTKLGDDKILYPDILKSSNFPVLPDKCPVPPGEWWVKDFLANADNFPELPNISEKWRADMLVYYKNELVGVGSVYMILKRI